MTVSCGNRRYHGPTLHLRKQSGPRSRVVGMVSALVRRQALIYRGSLLQESRDCDHSAPSSVNACKANSQAIKSGFLFELSLRLSHHHTLLSSLVKSFHFPLPWLASPHPSSHSSIHSLPQDADLFVRHYRRLHLGLRS
jgi:hypothetical protein